MTQPKHLFIPLLILLLAAALRWGYIAGAPRGAQFSHVDAQGYHWLAVNMLERGVYSMNTEPPYRANNVRAPLYPLFVAAWYAVGGPDPDYVAFVHPLIDVLTVAVLLKLGTLVGGRAVGHGAALLYALHPASWRFCNELLTEILFGLLLTTAVWMFARYLIREEMRDARRCGVAFGAAILCKPNVQFLPLALLILLGHGIYAGRQRLWRGAALLAGVIALLLMPWVVRNRVVFGEWFYTRTFDDNLAHVSAVATLAQVRGEAVAPWSQRWEELYGEVVEATAVRYDWGAVPESTLTTRERDERLQQIESVAKGIVLEHPVAFVVSHTRGWLWAWLPQDHKFWYTHLTGQAWETVAPQGDAFGRALAALGRGAVGTAGSILINERLLALPPLALAFWVTWGLGYALAGLLAGIGALRLRPRALALFLLATIFYVTFVPGPISQIRFRLPVTPLILLLVAMGLPANLPHTNGYKMIKF